MNSMRGSLDLRNLTTPTPGESISKETIYFQRRSKKTHTLILNIATDLLLCMHNNIPLLSGPVPYKLPFHSKHTIADFLEPTQGKNYRDLSYTVH